MISINSKYIVVKKILTLSLNVDALKHKIFFEWAHETFVHSLNHELFELFEIDFSRVVIIETSKECLDVGLGWLLLLRFGFLLH